MPDDFTNASEPVNSVAPNVHFFHRNLFDRIFEPDSIDTTLCNSTLHEIWSYGHGEKSVRNYLAEKFRQLRPGGRLLIRDVVGPDDGDQEILLWCSDDDGEFRLPGSFPDTKDRSQEWLNRLSTRSRFLLFSLDFLRGRRLACPENSVPAFPFSEETFNKRSVFRLKLRQAAEFLSKKDYTDNWSSEMNEEFCFWDFAKWKGVLTEIGFNICENPNHPAEGSRVYTNSWVVHNRFEGHAALFSTTGRSLSWPPTNMVLVSEKHPAGFGSGAALRRH